MLLAAGRGDRMRPLTDHLPKPLLRVGGKPLIVWHIERLAAAGITDIVINAAHLGDTLHAALGDGSAWGVRLAWSFEPPGALETAGGIAQALPLLGDAPFLVINGDIFCDWAPTQTVAHAAALAGGTDLAHLVLVDNPAHHPNGDFCLADGRVRDGATTAASPTLTFAGIGVYHPQLFANVPRGKPAKLAPLLRDAMAVGRVGGEHHHSLWVDVGTPQRLAELDAALSVRSATGVS